MSTTNQAADELREIIRTQIKEAVLHGREHHNDDIDYPVDTKTHELMSAIQAEKLTLLAALREDGRLQYFNASPEKILSIENAFVAGCNSAIKDACILITETEAGVREGRI